jgi:carbonic anhydrase
MDPMALLDDILAHNTKFVAEKQYVPYITDRFPDKKLVIITCMDTRLLELLPKAMNINQGEAKIIKVAGAVVSHPFGSVMRSILVAVYELGATEIAVVGHHGCGMTALSGDALLAKAVKRGVAEGTIDLLRSAGVELDRWLVGFESEEAAVRQTVTTIKKHPLLPKDVAVHGLVIDPTTGKLEVVSRG